MNDHSIERLFADYVDKGDISALGEVFDRVAPDLNRLARRLTRDRGQAQDLVQETFLTALERPETFEQGRLLRPWLLGILVHRARKEQRLMGRQQPEPTQLDSAAPGQALENDEFEEALRGAVDELPPSLRSALTGSLFEGRSPRELAQELSITSGTLRVRLHRGLERIRLILPASFATGFALMFIHSRGIAQVRSHVLKKASHQVGSTALATGAFTAGLVTLMTSKVALATIGGLVLTLIAALGIHGLGDDTTSLTTAEPTVSALSSAGLLIQNPDTELGVSRAQTAQETEQRQAITGAAHKPRAVRGDGWGHIELSVTDRTTGSAVVGLRLGVSHAGNYRPEELMLEVHVETNAKGTTAANLATGIPLTLELRGAGVTEPVHLLELEPLAEDETRHIAVQVDKELQSAYWVRILNDENGAPVPHAKIIEVDPFGATLLTSELINEVSWLDRSPLALVDALGLASLPRSSAKQRRFAVLAEGHAPAFFDEEEYGANEASSAYEVRLSRPAGVDILVLGSDGQPMASTQVRLDASYGELMGNTGIDLLISIGRHSVTRTTDLAGYARFDNLPVGVPFRTALTNSESRQEWQETGSVLELASGERRQLTLEALAPSDVYGVAFDQFGELAVGAQLVLMPNKNQDGPGSYLRFHSSGLVVQSTVVNENGEFSFRSIPAGRWLISPKPLLDPHAGPFTEADLTDQFAPVPTSLVLEGARPVVELNLNLWRDLYVRGTVIDDQDIGVNGAWVMAKLAGSLGFHSAVTSTDGSFILGPLPEGLVRVSASSYEPDASAMEVEVAPGDSKLTLRMIPRGTIRFITSSAATGAEIVCEFATWKTDVDGLPDNQRLFAPVSADCELDGLVAGTWNSLITASPNLVALQGNIEVVSGEMTDPIAVSLRPGGTLRVSRPEGSVDELHLMRVRIEGVQVGGGALRPGMSFELLLPAGTVEVIEMAPNGETLATVTVQLVANQRTEFLAGE